MRSLWIDQYPPFTIYLRSQQSVQLAVAHNHNANYIAATLITDREDYNYFSFEQIKVKVDLS